MRRFGMMAMLAMSFLLLDGNLTDLFAADKKKSECCGGAEDAARLSLPGPWVCPLFVLYDYGNGEYLYHAERREEDCYDEPTAAALFGSYSLPADCSQNQCEPGYFVKPEKKTVTYLKMDKPGESPKYRHSRPASERLVSHEDPKLKFIKFNGRRFGFDREIIARVNLIECYVGDNRLPNGRQVLQYCAWETDGSDLDGEEPILATVFSTRAVKKADGTLQGYLVLASVFYPESRMVVDIPVVFGDKP